MNRRDFMRLLGLSGAYAGVSTSYLGRVLAERAAVATPPKRLIVISHCHGWPYDAWKMRPEGFSEAVPGSFSLKNLPLGGFSLPLAPLYAHRHRLLPVDGLSLATAELDMDGNRHDTGWIHSWTGNWVDFGGADSGATSASLDQRVAAAIARPDRLPSLELSVDDAAEAGRPISYGLNGARMPAENDPAKLWQRLFGPSLAPNPLTLRQRSVLEFAHKEYAQLAPRLGSLQRAKLDSHFQLLHQLGDRIEGMASLTCGTTPQVPEQLTTFDERFDAFSELIGAAFSCDITRVVALSLGEMPTERFGAENISDDVHKGIAHDQYNSPEKHAAMADYVAVHAEQVARLVSLLESLPEGDGTSIMDNTLILWGSELADGWHGYRTYCPVILGGSWHFDLGRYVYRPHDTPIETLVPPEIDPSGYSTFSGLPHQHLLTSVGQAMGLGDNHTGIQHVQSQSGHWVDCRGPFPDLT